VNQCVNVLYSRYRFRYRSLHKSESKATDTAIGSKNHITMARMKCERINRMGGEEGLMLSFTCYDQDVVVHPVKDTSPVHREGAPQICHVKHLTFSARLCITLNSIAVT